MNNTNIRLFVGNPIEDPGEQAFISRLRRDLERLGVCATLYANFLPVARQLRQVDLLVRTAHRTAHVEIKSLRRDSPLRAELNGPWVQLLPDGTERSLDKNCGRQVLDGTFAISDAMQDMARSGAVAEPHGGFKRCIDSLVGIWEVIPDESDIQPPRYVEVLGYDDLLKRLTDPGPTVPWSEEEWDAFARSLGLFQPDADSEPERRRRNSLGMIGEYRLRARRSLADGLATFVDMGVADHDGGQADEADINRRLVGGAVLAVVGPSGYGKSFLAQHLAVRQCDDDCLAVWVRADEYQRGRLKELLARAMGPFSAHQWRALIQAAEESGTAITIVVDGLNECPNPARGQLLQQLRAFTLRHRASVLITSTADDGLRNALNASILRVREPDEQARRSILTAHGAKHPERISEQFRTPYELKIAAECESELDENASVTELHAAYIRRFAPTERIRAGLRSLASRMHEKLRSSLPLHEAGVILSSPDRSLVPDQADEVLGCRLLEIDRHRVRFRHDLIGQFFAAEEVVCSATSGENLGWLLGAPANTALTDTALSLEGDPTRVWEALRALASPELLFSALTAGYGPDVAEMAAQEIRDVIHRATAYTATTAATFTSTGGLFGHWTTKRRWTEWERALMAAAGKGLTRGLFVDEVCRLIDRTDEVCLAQVRRLHTEGDRAAISRVVAATYALPAAPDQGRGLPASYIVRAFGGRRARDWQPRGLAGSLAAGAGAQSWGRLYLALLSTDFRDAMDQALFTSLLHGAWDAGGYHLQLEALEMANFFGGSNEPYRSEILSVLRSLESNNPILRGLLVEVLAHFGEIENQTTAEELRARIRTTIAHAEDIDHCCMASGMVACQFEDQSIVGPYFEAIEGLTCSEKARLFIMAIMAARGSDPTLSGPDGTLHQLADLVPTGDAKIDNAAKSIFATFLDGPVEDAVAPQEAVNAWLMAIRGWAKFEAALPEATGLAPEQRNWRLVTSLLLCYERHDAAVDAEETWRALLLEPRETVLTLASLDSVTGMSKVPGLGRLVEDYPGPLRQLFRWTLDNPTEVPVDRLRRRTFADHFVIRMLGAVGDESTVACLRMLTKDPEAGRAAVAAIRQIHRRYEHSQHPARS